MNGGLFFVCYSLSTKKDMSEQIIPTLSLHINI